MHLATSHVQWLMPLHTMLFINAFYMCCSLVDNTPPEIQFCPSNINREIPIGVTSTVVIWPMPLASDNSGQQPTVQASHTSGSTFQVGLTTVTYTFADAAGNTNVCRFDVSVTSGRESDRQELDSATATSPCCSNYFPFRY